MDSKSKTCRNCGRSEFYVSNARFEGDAANALPIGWIFQADCRVRVCGGCGQVEWFVTGDSLSDVKEKYQRES